MAKISSLWVEIGANSAKFSQELKKTNSQAKSWGKDIKRSVGKATNVFAAAAGAVAATGAAITGLYSIQAKYIDDLGKQSAKLGDLAANLQAVRAAADFAGVGKSIDTAMQRLVRRMGEAAQGTGSALDAVKQLNLDAAELASRTATEQLQAVLDKLQEIPPGAERVRMAFKFFDTEGVGLVNLTTEAIRQSREELDRWGVTINEQQTAWVEATNDNLSRLKTFASGATIQLSTKLAPIIGAASQGILEWAENTINWGEMTDRVIGWIRKKWIEFRASLDSVRILWNKLEIGFGKFARTTLEGLSFLEVKVADFMNLFGDDIASSDGGVGKWLAKINEGIEENQKQLKQYTADLSSVLSEGLNDSNYAKAFDNAINENKRQAEEFKRSQIERQNAMRLSLSSAANDPVTSSAVIPFKANLGSGLSEAIRERNLKAAREAREVARAAAEAQRAQMKEMADQVRAVNGEIETFANRLGQGIAESADRGKQAVREMVADMLIQLAKVKLQQAYAASATPGGASSTFLGGLIGGLFSSQAVPVGAAGASASLNAGATAAGYAPSVINNIQVSATGEASGAVSSLRAGVRQLTEASPQQVATRAMRGGSYAQSFGR